MHSIVATARVSDLTYGFGIGEPMMAQFKVSRADPNNAGAFRLGMMVTFKRDDGLHPWAGYITERRMSGDDPMVEIDCRDHAGALFQIAALPRYDAEQTLSAGEWIRRMGQAVNARGQPPLDVQWPTSAGAPVAFTPSMESYLDFLRTMAEHDDAEWALAHDLKGDRVITRLNWARRLGSDKRNIIWERYTRSRFTQTASAFTGTTVAVGGTGSYAERPAEAASAAGLGVDATIAGNALPKARKPPIASPIFDGTVVTTHQSVTNRSALANAARRRHDLPPESAERLELTLAETDVNMQDLELGAIYTVKFPSLDFGLGIERYVRLMAFSLGQEGQVPCTVDVLDEDTFWRTRHAAT
jgi:hypothetical protein